MQREWHSSIHPWRSTISAWSATRDWRPVAMYDSAASPARPRAVASKAVRPAYRPQARSIDASSATSPLITRSLPLQSRDGGTCAARCTLDTFTRIKSAEVVMREHDNIDPQAKATLKRALTVVDLLGYGIGSTVGAGIYSLVGAGAKVAGPAVLVSFLIGAVSCVFTGLGYSEFAARVPVAGSAYTYAYTSFGELLAWIIGWNLTLEYAISAAAIARSWAHYAIFFMNQLGVTLPAWLANIPLTSGDAMSPLAAIIVLLCTCLMLVGAKKGSRFNVLVTCLNLAVLAFVTVAGSFKVEAKNWTAVNDSFAPYGASSVFVGAGTVFFSYLGFDMVTSLAEETEKPQRDMPLGIIGSLLVASLVYVAVTLVVTGMVPFTELTDTDQHMAAPLVYAFKFVGDGWATLIISVGSLFGLTTATFTCLFGQPRIFYRMAVDGLLPPVFAQLNAAHIPVVSTWITGIGTALIAFFVSLEILAEAISVGTLFAFSIVDAGVVVLRFRSEERPYAVVVAISAFTVAVFASSVCFTQGWSPIATIAFGALAVGAVAWMHTLPVACMPSTFRCPLVPLVPCLGIAINAFMMSGLSAASWIRLGAWTALGVGIYFSYGMFHSTMNKAGPRPSVDTGAFGPRSSIADDSVGTDLSDAETVQTPTGSLKGAGLLLPK